MITVLCNLKKKQINLASGNLSKLLGEIVNAGRVSEFPPRCLTFFVCSLHTSMLFIVNPARFIFLIEGSRVSVIETEKPAGLAVCADTWWQKKTSFHHTGPQGTSGFLEK